MPQWVVDELNKISHRTYSTGFYYGRPNAAQTYASAGYIRDYAVAAVVDGYDGGCVVASLKNKFFRSTVLDCLEPQSAPFSVPTDELFDGEGNPIESAPHPTMTVRIPFPREIRRGSLLRMKQTAD